MVVGNLGMEEPAVMCRRAASGVGEVTEADRVTDLVGHSEDKRRNRYIVSRGSTFGKGTEQEWTIEDKDIPGSPVRRPVQDTGQETTEAEAVERAMAGSGQGKFGRGGW